ncbi:GNAT family N-acetyltransferase [Paenibacillus puldeungensis]|uniref:GNAT family N-acetyltransferase n=1 Tax=Paenibacillus puldeungensis TaxID=696536 RepID=A0ABW3S295_9BACL
MSHSQVEVIELNVLDSLQLEQLADLLIQVVEDGASIGFLPPLSKDEALQYWQEVIGPGVILWVAVKNGGIVGTVQLHLALKQNGSHRAEVVKLMVHPEARKQGIARKLMLAVEEKAEREARSLLVLDTRGGDPSNLLYRSLGYIEAGRIPQFARSANGELHETVFYYKQL